MMNHGARRLIGRWTTEATHPAMPGVVVHGTAVVEWLGGERFLIVRATTDHPDFPDSLSVIGAMGDDRVDDATGKTAARGEEQLQLHYSVPRGVFRRCDVEMTDAAWRWWRDAPGFSQRFTGT
jgi:hypothetical protein